MHKTKLNKTKSTYFKDRGSGGKGGRLKVASLVRCSLKGSGSSKAAAPGEKL